jgi:hypothetical protein
MEENFFLISIKKQSDNPGNAKPATFAPRRVTMTTLQTLATAVRNGPHSFQKLRQTPGLDLTDEQFMKVVEQYPGRFKLVRFLKRDAEGQPIRPGRPGVKLRDVV